MRDRQSRLVDPLWYKDAIIYEARVGSFYDSNEDGIGDLPGLTQKLDFLQDLGITALWLLPFYPSPLKDDGYDISDYFEIHHQYGTINDFKIFLDEAHQRGINVITELVLNHTSDQHYWFQRARKSPVGSSWRNFYVWSDSPDKYKEARIIFKDFEHSNWTWDHEAKAYFWHRFYSHQPDLNYDHPPLREAVFEVVDFWLEMGVDGMRLDTIPYLFEREGTSCENLPETHEFTKILRKHIDDKFQNRMLLAEANQWPSDSVAYFGEGDECHMAFHFPIMPRLFMSIQLEDCFPLIDILNQTPPIPAIAQWALFLRNHDELTLEMVTDEERDYMYRTYAQDPQARLNLGIRRRLAPLLGNDRRKIELMNAILFSFPGTPIIYYGDEIGMGDNIYLGDRNGVRTPMQWNIDRNAGFSKANPQKLCFPITMDPAYSYETVNVETQHKNPNSLLWWTKRLIALRNHFKAFGRGTIEFLHTNNPKILAFIRRFQEEEILIIGNFSRSIQYAELDLSAYKGAVPYELFGRTPFPIIGEHPYFLTLHPYSFYWFGLHFEKHAEEIVPLQIHLPQLEVGEQWTEIFNKPLQIILEKHLLAYLKKQSWLRSKDSLFRNASIEEKIPIHSGENLTYLLFIRIEDDRGRKDTYTIPVAFSTNFELIAHKYPKSIITQITLNKKTVLKGVLYDAFYEPAFLNALLENFLANKNIPGLFGNLINRQEKEFQGFFSTLQECYLPVINQNNRGAIDVIFGNEFILKLFRNVEFGLNPEVEVERCLTRQKVPFIYPALGTIDYQQVVDLYNFGIFEKKIENQGTAWQYTLSEADRFFERAVTKYRLQPSSEVDLPLLDKMRMGPSEDARELIGGYLEWARMIGEVTAKMHLALASVPDAAFIPQVTTPFYLRSNFQSKRNLVYQVCLEMERMMATFSPQIKELAEKVIKGKESIIKTFEPLLNPKEDILRIRYHGDYHLGQLLFTGKDFIITDFENMLNRSFDERRRRRSALRDVAGMVRSFHFAIFTSLIYQEQKGVISMEQFPNSQKWPAFWQIWVSGMFLRSYRENVGKVSFVPQDSTNFILDLQAYLIETAIEDLAVELKAGKGEWLEIALRWVLVIQEQYPKIALLA
jgi:maltose alpha-D-glucosyltransferase/alpha-amylase